MATATAETRHAAEGPGSSADNPSGSKFKRFLRKFGRKPSDDAQDDTHEGGGHDSGLSQPSGAANGNNAAAQKRATKQRGNSLLGKNIGSRSRQNSAAPAATTTQAAKSPSQPSPGLPSPGLPSEEARFAGHGGQGLADTLVIPSADRAQAAASPPPQISSLPLHEALSPIEVADSTAASRTDPPLPSDLPVAPVQAVGLNDASTEYTATPRAPHTAALAAPPSTNVAEYANAGPMKAGGERGAASAAINSEPAHASIPAGALPARDTAAATALSESSGSPARSRADTTSFDFDSTDGIRKRDSVDNRTVDTGKSTKPTTLMSLETRDLQGTSGMAPIAQYRHGDRPIGSSSPTSAHGQRVASTASNAAVQFAAPTGRNSVTLPGATEEMEESPYVNVPTISRPHPSNNPNPSAIPPDNASVLTLASSTAAQSIGGGAASSRGHHHTPSLAGARSIGGSLMGERRNSSDTYASVKALPPLSRRGSDESTRTGRDSVAASATGLSSAQAMTGSGSVSNVNLAGPGAPHDRLSIQRTSSQRTVATQLSIPLSGSSAVLPSADRRASSGSAHLLAQTVPLAASGGATGTAPAKDSQSGFVSNLEGGGLSGDGDAVPAKKDLSPVDAQTSATTLHGASDMPGGLPTPGI
ncbi:unnamed protein product [Parajaminaea phylloscopi]